MDKNILYARKKTHAHLVVGRKRLWDDKPFHCFDIRSYLPIRSCACCLLVLQHHTAHLRLDFFIFDLYVAVLRVTHVVGTHFICETAS